MYEEEDRISIEDLLNELKKIIEELSSQFQKYKVPQHFRERRDISNNRTSFRSNRSLGNWNIEGTINNNENWWGGVGRRWNEVSIFLSWR